VSVPLLPVDTPAGDPSVLRFLIAAREEVNSTQLRDDLLSMLVAGHETTGGAVSGPGGWDKGPGVSGAADVEGCSN
jgi:hypothetical protein